MAIFASVGKPNLGDQRHKEREYFKVLSRASVSAKGDTYVLKYYPADRPDNLKEVPLSDLKTEDSSNDNEFKFLFIAYCAAIVSLMCAALFFEEILDAYEHFIYGPMRMNRWIIATLYLVFACMALVAGFFFLAGRLNANFLEIDKEWTNAIDQFLGQDVRTRMRGVRTCLLKFRTLIKWRRFTSFFLPAFWLCTTLAFLTAFSALIALGGNTTLKELTIFSAFLVALVSCLSWFSSMVDDHTSWRDPTVQLSVMIAELHERYATRNLSGAGSPKGGEDSHG